MNVIKIEDDGIAVGLHLIAGDDAYSTSGRQAEFQTGVRLFVIKE